MSAFMCSDEHLNRILDATKNADRHGDLTHHVRDLPGDSLNEKLSAAGRMMHAENLRSMKSRYGSRIEAAEEFGYRQQSHSFVYVKGGEAQRIVEPVEALKLIASWRYQSCEHPVTARDEATWAMVARFESLLIKGLPGYEKAEWSV